MKTLLWLTVCGSAFACLLLGLRKIAGKRLPPTLYYYAWLLVLMRFCLPLPGFLPAIGSAQPQPVPVYETAARSMAAEVPSTDAVQADTAKEPVQQTGIVAAPGATAPEIHKKGFSIEISDAVLIVWAVGSASVFAVRLSAYLRLRRRLTDTLIRPSKALYRLYAGIPGRKPRLYVSKEIASPLSLGILKPVIVLPDAARGREETEFILLHELVHFRRADALYKLIVMLVLSAQWFNPIAAVALHEIDRACELSCDAALLKRFSPARRRAYGHALLRAAEAALPVKGALTRFSASKETLKRRLKQIMSYKPKRNRFAAALLLPLLLALCVFLGPMAGNKASADEAGIDGGAIRTVTVANVDELLAAIAPNTRIVLLPGDYDLSAASDYALDSGSSYYSWAAQYDWDETGEHLSGAELRLKGLSNLTLSGSGRDQTRLLAVPRYANVLTLLGCSRVRIEGLTLGHTDLPGICSGGVLRLEACEDVAVDKSGLFGCGTVGVQASDCARVSVADSEIYSCSVGAVDTFACRDVLVRGCDIHSLMSLGMPAQALFSARQGDGFTVYDCRIHENVSVHMLYMENVTNARFLSNTVDENAIFVAFACTGYPVTVAGCEFGEDIPGSLECREGDLAPVSPRGEALGPEQLLNMAYEDVSPETLNRAAEPEAPASADLPAGAEIRVHDVEGLLSVLGSRRVVVLEDGLYDLASVPDRETERYSLSAGALTVRGVTGLTLKSARETASSVSLFSSAADAAALCFTDSYGLSFIGITFGPQQAGGQGAALRFEESWEINLYDCRAQNALSGIQLENSGTFRANALEMSGFAGPAFESVYADGLIFINCRAHDTASPAISFTASGDKEWNGSPVSGEGEFDVTADGRLKAR